MKLTHFLFPRLCLHCQSFLEGVRGLFCKECNLFFDVINPQERCFYCFKEHEKRLCPDCRQHKGLMIPIGCVWNYIGPVTTYMHRLKRDRFPSYMKLASSFLAVQFPRLSFPEPDYIVPVPLISWSVLWEGKSLNYLIAKQLSNYLKIPMKSSLYTNSLSQKHFRLKKRAKIEGKKILLVDVNLQKQTLEALQLAITAGDPEKVCAITLCCPFDEQ